MAFKRFRAIVCLWLASASRATPLVADDVTIRTEVSQHKTQGADVEHAELADAPQTITSEAAAFDNKGLYRSTARNAAAEMVKSRLATQTTRPAFEQGFASPRSIACDL